MNWPYHLANYGLPLPAATPGIRPADIDTVPLQTVEPQRLYRQIAEQLRASIGAGEWGVGERLPAKRDLAAMAAALESMTRDADRGVLPLDGDRAFHCAIDRSHTRFSVSWRHTRQTHESPA